MSLNDPEWLFCVKVRFCAGMISTCMLQLSIRSQIDVVGNTDNVNLNEDWLILSAASAKGNGSLEWERQTTAG